MPGKQTPRSRPIRTFLATGPQTYRALLSRQCHGGGASQTFVVRSVGGRTQITSLVTPATTAAAICAHRRSFPSCRMAVLTTIIIVYSVGLIDRAEFVLNPQNAAIESLGASSPCSDFLILSTSQGIHPSNHAVAHHAVHQSTNPKVYVNHRERDDDVLRPVSPKHPDDRTFDGLPILRPEGHVLRECAAGARTIRALVVTHHPSVLALDMSRVHDIEYSALQMLVEGKGRMADKGITVWLAALNPRVLGCIRSSLLWQIGSGAPATRCARGYQEISGKWRSKKCKPTNLVELK